MNKLFDEAVKCTNLSEMKEVLSEIKTKIVSGRIHLETTEDMVWFLEGVADAMSAIKTILMSFDIVTISPDIVRSACEAQSMLRDIVRAALDTLVMEVVFPYEFRSR